MTDAELDEILAALSGEGFGLPMEGEARREAIRRMKEAQAEVDHQNRDAFRRALGRQEQQ